MSRFTEGELLAALRRRFTFSGNGGAGRYALLTHVRTGAAWDQQEIDAVAVCLWPSDHYALLGFEVKCSRTDWLREIRPDTSKSERTRSLCDSFTMSEQIVLTVHGSGIVGEPLHLRGDGSPNCLTCHPHAFPARLVSTHGHSDLVAANDIHNANIKQLSERVGVVEQILSDAIPPQPGEPGYEATT